MSLEQEKQWAQKMDPQETKLETNLESLIRSNKEIKMLRIANQIHKAKQKRTYSSRQ